MVRITAAFAVAMTIALLVGGASGNEAAATAPDDEASVERADRSAARQAAEERLRARGYDADDDDNGPAASVGRGPLGSGVLGTVIMAAFLYLFVMRGQSAAAASWGSYNLFWIMAPAVLTAVSGRLEFLAVIVIGLLARRWLPDPFLYLKHLGRVRSLQADIDGNPSNATARRDLAKIWLEKHRPRRALPLLEQALARDPASIELLYLLGVAQLLAGQHEKAVESLVTVLHREPNFLYGEAYLRAADALMALGRWDDADDALDRYVKINNSSIEGRVKRVRVCKARKDTEGARTAQADLKSVWRALPPYQRRRQFGWYLRSFF